MTARHTPPRWLRWTLVVCAAVVTCLVYGISTASATLSLGPHEAVYEVETDGIVVVDLGPLGTLEIDSPLPLGLGVDVTVKEIPADLTAVSASTTLDRLVGDLNGYLQFYDSPQVTFDTVTRALVTDALWRSAGALVVVVTLGWLGRLALGAARRGELSRRLAPRTWQITAGFVLVGVVGGMAVSADPETPRASREASAVFDGTALEGARITGRLASVVDTYGGQLVDLYDENEAFYAEATDTFRDEWLTWEHRQVALQVAGVRAPDDPDVVTMLLVSDLHCNTGMSSVIAEAASQSEADVVLNAGDTTMNGTAVERVCVDAFADAVPDGVPMVVADGNHDSVLTSAEEEAHGQIVLDGDVVEVEGVRILGDRDALETRIGQGTYVARERTPFEQADELAATACDDGDVDLLMIHTPPVGTPAMESGCVPFQVSGHTHVRTGPEQIGQGIRYVNASTAGAASGQPTVGPLRGTAEMTLLRFDPEERRMLDLQVLSVDPDGSVTVGEREAIPAPVPPIGMLDAPAPDADGDEALGPTGGQSSSEAPEGPDPTGEPAG